MILFVYSNVTKIGETMRKVIKFQNSKKPVIVTKQGIQYKRMDLGGYTIDVRIKSAEEMKGDVELFRKKKK
tara:strand:+ start:80 stop:292 length:213 start_codon:yes stop_codon:yes gene_type:complete